MITKCSALLCIVLGLLCFGCGSDTSSSPSEKPGRGPSANANKIVSSGTPAPSNASIGPGPADTTPDGAANDNQNKKLKDIRAAGGDPSAPKPTIETVLKNSERPAPEDSVFAVALVDNVVERRTFLKHPIIAKVEKVTNGDGTSSLKVVTRNGKTFELAGNAIGPVSTASTTTILRAIGLDGPKGERKQGHPAVTEKN